MKKTFFIAILVSFMSMSLVGCITTSSTSKINKIEIGMTKENIRKLLGNPVYRNAWEEGEQWGYHKQVGEIAGSEHVLLVVSFDGNGKVAQFETVKEFPRMHYHH